MFVPIQSYSTDMEIKVAAASLSECIFSCLVAMFILLLFFLHKHTLVFLHCAFTVQTEKKVIYKNERKEDKHLCDVVQ